MRKQRGSFKGIDTCSFTNFGYLGFTWVLLDESESISITMRPYIYSLLQELQIGIYISVDAENEICARRNFLHPD